MSKDLRAKLESAYSLMLKYSKITVCYLFIFQEKFALGSCSARHECIGGPPTLKSSSWAVGLGIFLICYTIFMFFAIWMYCKYCRNRKTEVASGEDGGKKPELVLKPESVIDD